MYCNANWQKYVDIPALNFKDPCSLSVNLPGSKHSPRNTFILYSLVGFNGKGISYLVVPLAHWKKCFSSVSLSVKNINLVLSEEENLISYFALDICLRDN